jgi:hypothetical protein
MNISQNLRILIRYSDTSLLRLPDLSEEKRASIGYTFSVNLMPTFAKFNEITAGWHERENLVLRYGLPDS